MTKRQDFERKYAAAAELRTKKVDEIRELLAIPPDPDDEQAVEFIARWRETGEVSVPAQLLTKAQRLLREWHSIHKACMEIQNEFEQIDKKANTHRITAAESPHSHIAIIQLPDGGHFLSGGLQAHLILINASRAAFLLSPMSSRMLMRRKP